MFPRAGAARLKRQKHSPKSPEMTPNIEQLQRISVLRPYSDVLNWIRESVVPVAITNMAPLAAVGATFAADFVAGGDYPLEATALIDGWAVSSDQITDASSYAPAVFEKMPPWVNVGQPIPRGADAVIAADTLARVENRVEIYAPAVPGDGVVQPAGSVSNGQLLCEEGNRILPLHAAVLRQLDIASVAVRLPKIRIVPLSVAGEEADYIGPVIADIVRANGAVSEIVYGTALEHATSEFDCDAIIAIGQTGSGIADSAVKSLSRIGTLAFHGVGIAPGQTAALGIASGRLLLMLPGRLDAAMSVVLTIGLELVKCLARAKEARRGLMLPLTKKISSTIGMAEVVFVRVLPDGAMPLGSGIFAEQRLLQADGWVLIPEGSEGVPAGSNVEVRRLS
jgi:molybdopterin molybdotransferase